MLNWWINITSGRAARSNLMYHHGKWSFFCLFICDRRVRVIQNSLNTQRTDAQRMPTVMHVKCQDHCRFHSARQQTVNQAFNGQNTLELGCNGCTSAEKNHLSKSRACLDNNKFANHYNYILLDCCCAYDQCFCIAMFDVWFDAFICSILTVQCRKWCTIIMTEQLQSELIEVNKKYDVRFAFKFNMQVHKRYGRQVSDANCIHFFTLDTMRSKSN